MSLGNMTSFMNSMISALTAFIRSEPIVYLFGFVALALVIKCFLLIISGGKE